MKKPGIESNLPDVIPPQRPTTTFYVPGPVPIIDDPEKNDLHDHVTTGEDDDTITPAISNISSESNLVQSQTPRDLPYGCESREDHLGRKYYVDSVNRRSTRHRPTRVGYPAGQPVTELNGSAEQVADDTSSADGSHGILQFNMFLGNVKSDTARGSFKSR